MPLAPLAFLPRAAGLHLKPLPQAPSGWLSASSP